MNGSRADGKPALVRWTASVPLIDPDVTASQMHDLNEAKDAEGQLDVLNHEEFIKLLPDEIREAEQAVLTYR